MAGSMSRDTAIDIDDGPVCHFPRDCSGDDERFESALVTDDIRQGWGEARLIKAESLARIVTGTVR